MQGACGCDESGIFILGMKRLQAVCSEFLQLVAIVLQNQGHLCWEANIICMKFWHKVITDSDYENCIIKKVALDALSVNRGSWIEKLHV